MEQHHELDMTHMREAAESVLEAVAIAVERAKTLTAQAKGVAARQDGDARSKADAVHRSARDFERDLRRVWSGADGVYTQVNTLLDATNPQRRAQPAGRHRTTARPEINGPADGRIGGSLTHTQDPGA